MTLLLGVLLASLAGSIHCAAMCGAFVCAYAAPTRQASPRGLTHAAYHLGRLTSYVTLGATAGWIGSGVDRIGALVGIGRAAAIVAGVLMVAWGLNEIARASGVKLAVRLPGGDAVGAKRLLGSALLAARDRSATFRAAALGLLTTLIPCGWLYAFVVTAGATGSAVTGAVTMLAFWTGTVPALMIVAVSARRAAGSLGRRFAIAAPALVVVLGLLSISGRLHPPVLRRVEVTHVSH